MLFRSAPGTAPVVPAPKGADAREAKKAADAEARKKQRAEQQRAQRIAELEGRIAEKEQAIKAAELEMAAPGFYDDRDASKRVIDRHQSLMWEVGDLMAQWEELQNITIA